MKMTPAIVIIGSILVFWASMSVLVIMPAVTMEVEPSELWRPMTVEEEEGFRLYVQNGCSYCHSQFIRTMDWGKGAERIAEAGDYVGRSPVLLGSKRTGPDLSQEGGEHPDDWHLAHFTNPRNTSPISVMPSFEFLGREKLEKLTAFVQYQGMQLADQRVARQQRWKKEALLTFGEDLDRHVQWLQVRVPPVWQRMPNPYPAKAADLERGRKIYQQFCIGCHGPVGDGKGTAAPYLNPPPLNFTVLRRNLVENRYIGGLIYYQVMNGITGTAMPYFKKELESEKIWDVANYVAVSFIGYSDADIEPEGIDAAYESEWNNPYQTPDKKGLSDERDTVGR
jgi:cbb3-type cytochrome oxidase cytochrome c subunit/mono/diheme cytochrome c family protein